MENGNIIAADHPKKQRLFMFGAGRRSCPGEQFAKNRIFILLTMMLQRFRFLPAPGEQEPQTDPHDYMAGLPMTMKPYKMQLKPRK